MNASKQQESEQNIANFSGNWPEDFGSENGNYMNACQDCGRHFLGHKRRFTCKLCWLAKTNPDNYETSSPATPSADEEIERTVFKCTGCGKKEDITALLSASHANEREEWIKRSEEWRINAEEKRNHLKTAEATLAAREGEIERLKEKVANQAKVWSTELSALQAELATAQSRNKFLEDYTPQTNLGLIEKIIQAHMTLDGAAPRNEGSSTLSLAERCSALRSQLTEAQAEKERIRGQLISHERMAAKGVYVDTEKYEAMVAQLTEANAKLAGLESVIDFIRDAAFRIHGDTGVQKIDAALKGRVSP